MNATDFFLQWNGKQNDNGSFKGQCVNIVHQYFNDVLGLPPFIGNAITYWNAPPANFQKITKTWYNQPQPGDLVVFNYPPSGHIAICNWSRLFDFGGFEQNFPIGSPCHYQDHPNYKNVLGWLRPSSRPRQNGPFVMQYTVFNGDPVLMEAARQLLVQFSGGKVDAKFTYETIGTAPGIFTSDRQVAFVKLYPVPFIFYFYDAQLAGYSQIATAQVPGTQTVLSAATPQNQTALNTCYEFVNGLYAHLGKYGDDNYTPTEDFVKQKLLSILPALSGTV